MDFNFSLIFRYVDNEFALSYNIYRVNSSFRPAVNTLAYLFIYFLPFVILFELTINILIICVFLMGYKKKTIQVLSLRALEVVDIGIFVDEEKKIFYDVSISCSSFFNDAKHDFMVRFQSERTLSVRFILSANCGFVGGPMSAFITAANNVKSYQSKSQRKTRRHFRNVKKYNKNQVPSTIGTLSMSSIFIFLSLAILWLPCSLIWSWIPNGSLFLQNVGSFMFWKGNHFKKRNTKICYNIST